jgi:ATP-dependent helicase HrpB
LEQFAERGELQSAVGTLNRNAARHILRTRDQLARQADNLSAMQDGVQSRPLEEAFLRAILAAFPDRLARRREPGSRRGVMVGGRGVRLADESALADEELYVCVDVDAGAGESLVRQASAVRGEWLPSEQLVTSTIVEFDEVSGKVVARKRLTFDSLVLEESQAALPSDDEVARALAAAALVHWPKAFPGDDPDIASFCDRVRCLTQWIPDLNLPRLDEPQLQSLLPQLAFGRRSLADLRKATWLQAIKGLLTWQQLQTVDREAPERIEVPSGSKIAVQYEPGRPPILAVRIQEVFGLHKTPRVAGGRIPVLIHLLAPNMRVAQVTDDLASFWANTYALVRKDLRARYPKHSWPEDPYTAIAQRRPTRKK